ncbi:hypothetical protein [Streptomyces malaysiensis]|uniref:hypothetical protein n=1 Tax=Streptomyces TaxID=1883 RepID=UPI00362EA9A7
MNAIIGKEQQNDVDPGVFVAPPVSCRVPLRVFERALCPVAEPTTMHEGGADQGSDTGQGDITSAVGPFRMVSFDGTGVLACLSLFG